MILTLILLSIGALLFLVIAYNVVQQYKQKAESDKRQAIARHKAVADETEEVLLNVNLVPFSKNMVLLGLVETQHAKHAEAEHQPGQLGAAEF